jgi:aldehyde dehydrogenase (NAD+)
VIGDGTELGKKLSADVRIPLISATGSTAMGKSVASVVGARLGRSLLELGGNNAVIIMDDADLSIAIPSTLFGAVGTTGQRCTTTRRLIVHSSIIKTVTEKITAAYGKIKIGNPLDDGVMIGPLVNGRAVKTFEETIRNAVSQGGSLLYGGELLSGFPSSLYVRPAIVKATRSMPIVREENFVPVLYILEASSLDEAIEIQNESDHGLSSSLFTRSVKNSEIFMSPRGSDCGIANVNTGTSQAEVGGAFGGEKDTGGGREAGSDCWMQYMRRQTSTVNYSDTLLLAQALKFE